jgi:hypothetical protein
MKPTLEELSAILAGSNLLKDCACTREAVWRCCCFFREEGRFDPPIFFKKIGELLRLDRKTVWKHWNSFQKFGLKMGESGRPSILSDAQVNSLVQYALERFYAMEPVTMVRLSWFVRTVLRTDVEPDTLRKIVQRDGRIKTCHGHPMEQERVQVQQEDLVAYFSSLQGVLDGVPPEFVWNMDEIGHADWPDAHDETIFVPGDVTFESFPIPVSRAGKRITLVAGICADGSYLKPMVVIPRHTIDGDLKLFGISERNCAIVHQPNGFIDRELFEEWFVSLFVPEIQARREAMKYEGPCILILDGCTAHDGDYFWDLSMENGILPAFIPPHSSNQVQPCDLCVFGLTKRLMTRFNKFDEGNVQSIHIAKLVSAFHSACNPVNVIASFRNAGIACHLEQDGRVVACVDVDHCRCLLHVVTQADIENANTTSEEVSQIDAIAMATDPETSLFGFRFCKKKKLLWRQKTDIEFQNQ